MTDRLRQQRATFFWLVIGTAVIVGAAIAWAVTGWLLSEASRAQDPAASRIDAIKTGLTIGVGTIGAFALLLAVRRQWHQEITAADTKLDAEERRITELYTKAVDQLGAATGPVRLGGLHALERLAQDNPGHRQTVVNVLCAYLRMPYTPPSAVAEPSTDAGEVREELQVRIAAQRILSDHLSRGPDQYGRESAKFWRDMDLDLTNATLINLDFQRRHLRQISLDGAKFIGHARFDGATFTRTATFHNAEFTWDAWFDGARFVKECLFDEARFAQHAVFRGSVFERLASFNEAEFGGLALFDAAEFERSARFTEARFLDEAQFDATAFAEGTSFARATFLKTALFREATFPLSISLRTRTSRRQPSWPARQPKRMVGFPQLPPGHPAGVCNGHRQTVPWDTWSRSVDTTALGGPAAARTTSQSLVSVRGG